MAMDDNLKYALEAVGRIASKNTESRISKNLDFLFGFDATKIITLSNIFKALFKISKCPFVIGSKLPG